MQNYYPRRIDDLATTSVEFLEFDPPINVFGQLNRGGVKLKGLNDYAITAQIYYVITPPKHPDLIKYSPAAPTLMS